MPILLLTWLVIVVCVGSIRQCLSRALRNENPKLLMTASALFLPIQPLMVSAVHTGIMEVVFPYLTSLDIRGKTLHLG